MGEVLHEVDFNYLKIENKQYLEKIDDKNLEFTKLKLQTGETEKHLNQYKESLARLVNRAEELQPEIQMKNEMLAQLRDEIAQGKNFCLADKSFSITNCSYNFKNYWNYLVVCDP